MGKTKIELIKTSKCSKAQNKLLSPLSLNNIFQRSGLKSLDEGIAEAF